MLAFHMQRTMKDNSSMPSQLHHWMQEKNAQPFGENPEMSSIKLHRGCPMSSHQSLVLCYCISPMECEPCVEIDAPFCHFVFHFDLPAPAQRTFYSNSFSMTESDYKDEITRLGKGRLGPLAMGPPQLRVCWGRACWNYSACELASQFQLNILVE